MLGIRVYAPGDTLGFSYPALGAIWPFNISSLVADPLSGRGFPWITTYGTLDPIAHLARVFFNEFLALAWICYFYTVLSGWFFALYLKRLGRSDIASFIGGLVYVGAFFWVADGDYAFPLTLALFPALLLNVSFGRTNPWRTLLFTILLVADGWLAGHFNFVPLLIVATGVVLLVDAYRSSGTVFKRLQPTVIYTIGTIMGSLFGLIRLVPAFSYLSLSERSGGLSVDAAGKAALTLSSIYTALFPYMTIPFVPGEVGLLFFGAAGLALLSVGILQRDRKLKWTLIGLALCFIIVLPHSPLYALIQSLPFFSFLRAPRRWLFVAYAAIGVVIATAADDIQDGRTTYVRGIGSTFLTIGSIVAGAAAIVTVTDLIFGQQIIAAAQQYFDAHYYAQTSGLSLEYYHQYIVQLWKQGAENFSPLQLQFTFPLAGLLVTGWAFKNILPTAKEKLPVLAVLSVVSLIPSFFFHHPQPKYTDLTEALDTWTNALLGEAIVFPILPGIADQTVRTGVYGDDPRERIRYQIGLLVPNTQALAHVHSIDFYQPIQPTRMARLLAALGSTSAPAPSAERLTLEKITPEEKIQKIAQRLPLLQRLGVEYVSSVWDMPSPFIYEKSLSFVERLPDIKLYRLPDTMPIAYMPSHIRIQNVDEDAAIAYVRDAQSVDPTIIECNSCAYGERSQVPGEVEVIEHLSTSIDIAVDTEVSGYLSVLLPRLPGWRAYVDGEEVQTGIADAMFFAVPVPGGKHAVTLKITYATLFADSLRMLIEKTDTRLL